MLKLEQQPSLTGSRGGERHAAANEGLNQLCGELQFNAAAERNRPRGERWNNNNNKANAEMKYAPSSLQSFGLIWSLCAYIKHVTREGVGANFTAALP